MTKTALFFRDADGSSSDLDPLLEGCRREQFEIVIHDALPDHDSLKSLLPSTPVVVFLPVLEEDCLGIKLAQIAQVQEYPHVIVLYASSLPSGQYLCLAFREGVDDVISLDAGPDMLGVQVKRAEQLLKTRLDSSDVGVTSRHKIESLELACRHLAQRNAKWEERLLALASTTGRLATGELHFTADPSALLIVATSRSQGAGAAELAGRLGFDTHVVHTGQEALEWIPDHPPRIILMDGTLPDMDATALARSVRQVLGNRPIVIVAWSSSAEAEEHLLAPEAGIDDFVLKSATSEGSGYLVAALLGGLR